MQSVKEVLQSLVDDGLVDTDRIGTSNYFWSFPSKASNIVRKRERITNSCLFVSLFQRKRRRDELLLRSETLKKRKTELTSLLNESMKGREDSVRYSPSYYLLLHFIFSLLSSPPSPLYSQSVLKY